MIKNIFKNKKGQMLIELMVALGVLTVGFLGMVSLLSKAVALNRTISENYQATYLATEGVEIVKNILDANLIQGKPWNDGFSGVGSYELQYDSTSIPSSFLDRVPEGLTKIKTNDEGFFGYNIPGENIKTTSFTREIKLERVGGYAVRVNSIVRWTSRGGGEFETNIEDYFYNWR